MSSTWTFAEPARAALAAAGWTPGRDVDIAAWTAELAPQGYELNEPAEQALRSFGGLTVDPVTAEGPNFANEEPLTVDPILAGSGHHVLADELRQAIGGSWYPFGQWLSYSSVFIDGDGRTVATGLGWIWELGPSVRDAVEFALLADHPLRCLRVLAPGAEPWPPA